MELKNDFRVGVDRDTTWKVLTDLERIAPLLPGAQLQEVEGDEYRGVVKVKVGPIQAQYKGTATLVETDQEAGKMVMKASGRDTRGQGNASATITLTMTPDGTGTKVTTNTDLTISGKVAQFGRGALADVSSKLISQFVDNLEADLNAGDQGATGSSGGSSPGGEDQVPDEGTGEALVGKAERAETNGSTGASQSAGGPVGPGTTAPSPSGTESTSSRTSTSSGGGSAPESASSGGSSSGARKIDSPEPEPVDLFDAAGGTIKKAAPVAGAVVLVIVALLLFRHRRKARKALKAAALLKAGRSGVRTLASGISLPDPDSLVDAGRRARKRAAKRRAKPPTKRALAQARKAAEQGRKAAEQSRKAALATSRKARKRAAAEGRQAMEEAAAQARQALTAARKAAEDAARRAAEVPKRDRQGA